jgi:hypothetical protein
VEVGRLRLAGLSRNGDTVQSASTSKHDLPSMLDESMKA